MNCGFGDCSVDCPGEYACESARINPSTALSFTCRGQSGIVECPPNYAAPPVALPSPPPSGPCHGMPPCPCFHAVCFEARNPVSCQCECPFQILWRAHIADGTLCGNTNPKHTFLQHSCACDCPIGAKPLTGCSGVQMFNPVSCQCECPDSRINRECGGSATLNPYTVSFGLFVI